MDYDSTPVSPRQFFTDENYLGSLFSTIHPKWLNELDIVLGQGSSVTEWVLRGAIGTGKCCCGDTRVRDCMSGREFTLEELHADGRSISVQTYDSTNHSLCSPPVSVFISGHKPVCSILLKSGRRVRLSLDHPVRVPGGWKNAGTLKCGEFVAISRSTPSPWAPLKISDAAVKFIAHMITEGSLTSRNFSFCNKDPLMLDDFKGSIEGVSGEIGIAPGFSEFQERGVTTVRPRGLRGWARSSGLSFCGSRKKSVPGTFFGLDDRQLGLFINRLWAGDGHISAQRKEIVLEYYSSSRLLCEQVASLLLRFSIVARIRKKRHTPSGTDSWRVIVSSAPSIIKFFNAVGEVLGKEEQSKLALEGAKGKAFNPNWDVVPFGGDVVARACNVKGLRKILAVASSELSTVVSSYRRKKSQCIGIGSYEKIISSLQFVVDEGSKALSMLGQYGGDIFWDRVESVEIGGIEPVYDFTIPKTHCFTANDIIVHNSTAAAGAQLYKVYQLLCLKDPAAFYGLLPLSPIVFGIFNITLDRAEGSYDRMKEWVDKGPVFSGNMARLQRPSDPIKFPDKNVSVVVGSLDTHVLGDSVFGFTIDEANFFKRIVGGKGALERHITRAQEIYLAASRRQISRFLQFGSVPGLNCYISSETDSSSFIEERIRTDESSGNMHVTSFALWDVPKREGIYSSKTFSVLIGNEHVESRILEDEEVVPEGFETCDVPIDFLKPFRDNVDDSLRDLAGRSVTSSGKFFRLVERVHSCVDHTRVHPFTVYEPHTISSDAFDETIGALLNVDALFHIERSRYVPNVDPHAPRAAHVDIGLVGDSLGIAIGHLTDIGTLYFDIVLRIRPPVKGEVDIDAIVAFFDFLRKHGMVFKSITYDQYQSKQSVQQLKKLGFEAATQAVGLKEYMELRRRIYAGSTSCSYYEYHTMLREFVDLEEGPMGKSPDHPIGGGKDVIDACAGVAIFFADVNRPRIRESSYDRIQRSLSMLPDVGSYSSKISNMGRHK